MKSYISKLIANTGFVVTFLYAVLNLVAVILYGIADFEKVGWYIELVLGIDVVTWIFYCIFTMVSFILLISTARAEKTSKKLFVFICVLHLVLMVISFVCINIIFDNSF